MSEEIKERSIEWLKGQARRRYWLANEKDDKLLLAHIEQHLAAGDVVCTHWDQEFKL